MGRMDVGQSVRGTVMQQANRPWASVLGATLALGALSSVRPLNCAANERADASAGAIVTSAWQHHKATFSYFGVTTLFTCNALELHVRDLLVHIGARKDASVIAGGCPGPNGGPSHSALVTVDFYTLVPVADAGQSDTVKARWTPLEVTPRRPQFMGDGDCELMQGMKDVITQNFSLRDLEYRTSCYPHELSPDGFAVKGQALRAVTLTSSALTG
jgi:hypothetical protein